jgi:hypothetical protein
VQRKTKNRTIGKYLAAIGAGAIAIAAARCAKLRAHILAAFATAGGDAKFLAQGFKGIGSLLNARCNLACGHGLADTDIHESAPVNVW